MVLLILVSLPSIPKKSAFVSQNEKAAPDAQCTERGRE
jgi:hypothetical protein